MLLTCAVILMAASVCAGTLSALCSLVEHRCLCAYGALILSSDISGPLSVQVSETPLSEQQQGALVAEIGNFEAWLEACAESPPAGYITLAKPGGALHRPCLMASACGWHASF